MSQSNRMQFNRDLYNQWEERRRTGLETGEENDGDEAEDDEDDDPLADLNSYLTEEREVPYNVFGANELGEPFQGAPNIYQVWPYQEKFVGKDWSIAGHFPQTMIPETRCKSELIQNPVFIKMLGQGAFGQVWEVDAEYDLFNGEGWDQTEGKRARMWEYRKFAVKVLYHQNIRNIYQSFNEMETLLLVRHLRHPNICNYADVIGIEDRETKFPYSIICMFFELCDGNLHQLTSLLTPVPDSPEGKIVISENLNRHWFAQIASALVFLHDKGIAHSDIKMENILFKSTVDHSYTINETFMYAIFKLGDFGISMTEENDEYDFMKFNDMNLLYMILFTLGIEGRSEQYEISNAHQNEFIQYCRGRAQPNYEIPQHWTRLSDQFKDLIVQMSQLPNPFIPNSRGISENQILEHHWLQMNKDPRTEPYVLRHSPEELEDTFLSSMFSK